MVRFILAALACTVVSGAAPIETKPLYGPVLSPNLTLVGVAASIPGANLRDPTSPLYNPVDGQWHFWCTHVPKAEGEGGYPGRVWHFYSSSLDAQQWNTSGMAINVSEPGHFDSHGVFTPSAFFDASARGGKGEWMLLFGGVPTNNKGHVEAIGLATAPSPFGPWTKSPMNPVIDKSIAAWCSGSAARVDEAEPYIIGGKPVILVKTVCNNFTALPMLLAPQSGGDSLFTPPYTLLSNEPIIHPPQAKGFEQARVYPGPDGRLHMTGHDHGGSGIPHFVLKPNSSGLLGSWDFVGFLTGFPLSEPTLVWNKGSVPGDDPSGVPSRFIAFSKNGKTTLEIVQLTAEWM